MAVEKDVGVLLVSEVPGVKRHGGISVRVALIETVVVAILIVFMNDTSIYWKRCLTLDR